MIHWCYDVMTTAKYSGEDDDGLFIIMIMMKIIIIINK